MARDPGNPSVGPSRQQPWRHDLACLTLGGPTYEPWDPEPIVNPAAFRDATIARRLRRFGISA